MKFLWIVFSVVLLIAIVFLSVAVLPLLACELLLVGKLLSLCVAIVIEIVLVLLALVCFVALEDYKNLFKGGDKDSERISKALTNREHTLTILCALCVPTIALILMFAFAVFYVSKGNQLPNNQNQMSINQNQPPSNQNQMFINQNQMFINQKQLSKKQKSNVKK